MWISWFQFGTKVTLCNNFVINSAFKQIQEEENKYTLSEMSAHSCQKKSENHYTKYCVNLHYKTTILYPSPSENIYVSDTCFAIMKAVLYIHYQKE